MSGSVLVVGSINSDLTVRAPRIPEPGETVLGFDHFTGLGGKGANQAVAAARLGSAVSMVGRVGDDNAGRVLVADLAAAGVDTTGVGTDPVLGTGLALITLDDDGENSIVVSPGANSGLTPAIIERSVRERRGHDVCLAQLEIPVESVEAAAATFDGLFVLNPAPAMPISPRLLDRADVLVPNRAEAAILASGGHRFDRDGLTSLVREWGVPRVVVTLGPDGAFVFDDGDYEMVVAPAVDAVDTTGCGDAFCAALAVSLAEGNELAHAARWACVAGAITATRPGASSAMPTLAEVEALAQA